MSESWFGNVEAITYSVVEYLPGIGTVYSYVRGTIASRENDTPRMVQSLVNAGQGAVRDILLAAEIAEPALIVLGHTILESVTDKLADIFTADEKPSVSVTKTLDQERDHIVIAGSEAKAAEFAKTLFEGKAVGIHQFHGSIFNGTLVHPTYAPEPGQRIQLSLPRGLSKDALCDFTWRWTVDAEGEKNRAEVTIGTLHLEPAEPHTRFSLGWKTGVSWAGYDFSGTIVDVNTIKATTTVLGSEVNITFIRRGA